MRVKFVAGNWKMNGSLSANDTLLKDLVPALAALSGMESAVCPPYPYLAQVQCARCRVLPWRCVARIFASLATVLIPAVFRLRC